LITTLLHLLAIVSAFPPVTLSLAFLFSSPTFSYLLVLFCCISNWLIKICEMILGLECSSFLISPHFSFASWLPVELYSHGATEGVGKAGGRKRASFSLLA
jgi:predicted membrane metal-binding protein